MHQPYLKKTNGVWHLYHANLTEAYDREVLLAREMTRRQEIAAERNFRRLIYIYGNLAIESMHDLAEILNGSGRDIEGNALIHKAHLICMEAIPSEFNPGNDEVIWEIAENRPWLRSFFLVAQEYMKEKQYRKALDKIYYLLQIDPQDHFDIVSLIPECYMQLHMFETYLDIYHRIFAARGGLETEYWAFLSYYKLNRLREAAEQFKKARQLYPHMATELSKTVHHFQGDGFGLLDTGEVEQGSRQQAFRYWVHTQHMWSSEPDLPEFLRCIS
ncbi:MAG TPA: hypothetical protein VM802_22915 [Chitinophaga sp.]|uniref:tetratricopeptide repeat protein n=1 Tax=Chitinophaga sp. TaxID=1869181 RepID=UPI002D1AB5DD|nr:hypothetical protein [Chitinophaga sp.]HVI47742.1 hypothetical protein [Chitinophaga sp.]